jgi:hypothetical protein
MGRGGLDSSDSGLGPVVGSCEQGNEPSGSLAEWLLASQEGICSMELVNQLVGCWWVKELAPFLKVLSRHSRETVGKPMTIFSLGLRSSARIKAVPTSTPPPPEFAACELTATA